MARICTPLVCSSRRENTSTIKKRPLEVQTGDGWDRTLPCINLAVEELETHGWLVNQTRMWLSSDWSVRHGQDWRKGEDRFFQHLIDGSRALTALDGNGQQESALKVIWI